MRAMTFRRVAFTCVVLMLVSGTYAMLSATIARAQSGTRSQSGSRPQGGTSGRNNQQRGDQNSGTRQQESTTRQAPFEERLWSYLQAARYKNWAPMPGQTDDFYPGQSPHGAALKIYINRKAAGNPDELPPGSVIVKENYGPDQETLMAITAMYRSNGYDPEHGDWYWVKYEPDGRVSQMDGMPVAGRVQMCIDCHSAAEGDDFVFEND